MAKRVAIKIAKDGKRKNKTKQKYPLYQFNRKKKYKITKKLLVQLTKIEVMATWVVMK